MKVIIKEVGKNPEVREIENELSVFQELVGGYIETVTLGDVILICNEEGKLNGSPVNFRMGYDTINGTAVFVSSDGENFAGLDDWQIENIMSKFY